MERRDRSDYWILDKNHKAIPATLGEWAELQGLRERIMFETEVGDATVVTAFFGFDHEYSIGLRDEPLLFGTAIKRGDVYSHQTETATYMAASDAHYAVVPGVEPTENASQ